MNKGDWAGVVVVWLMVVIVGLGIGFTLLTMANSTNIWQVEQNKVEEL